MLAQAHNSYSITDDSLTGELRRAVRDLAAEHGFTTEGIGKAEIIVSELASNLVKHAISGREILINLLDDGGINALEMISLDSGPGIADTRKMLQDGVSTAGTLGGGLGAIRRLSDEFEIHSRIGRGTAILSRVLAKRTGSPSSCGYFLAGAVTVPLPGERACGNAWAIAQRDNRLQLILVDGLGHGDKANTAAEISRRCFAEHTFGAPRKMIEMMHECLRPTAGAALAIADINRETGRLTYAGVGNISGRLLLNGNCQGCISTPGVIGFRLPTVQEFVYPWADQSMLLMYTDGLLSSTNGAEVTCCHPSLAAAILYRDFKRGTDDVGVAVIKGLREIGG